MNLILASASPRRLELLRRAGFDFAVIPAHINEKTLTGENPHDYVSRLAREKAATVAREAKPDSIILGADTIVVLDDVLLEKPRDAQDAYNMLQKLSGRQHQVLTGFAVIKAPDQILCCRVETSTVVFDTLNNTQINDYIATGEPFDKAGAYAIQGLAGNFVRITSGLLSNVIGLPIERVKEVLISIKI